VDECADPGICPEHATCHNSPGSYSCVCNLGFESSSGNVNIQGPGETCEDIDECLHMCPSNATCTNTPGSYFCTCSPGFVPSNGQPSFTDQEVECRDIDECSQDPSPCGPNSVCTNALGSYSCSCTGSFQPNPEGSLNFSCKKTPFKCKEDVIPNNEQVQLCKVGGAVEPEHGSFCTLMNATLSVLDNACGNRTAVVSLKSAVESFASVLEQTSTSSNFTKEETSALATVVLESVKSTTLAAFLKPSANVSQTVQTEHLDESFFQDPETPLANSQRKLKVKMNSRVVQGIMTGEKKDGFSDPIIYMLEHIEPKQEFERPICVSWDTDVEGGRWTPSGCVVLEASETHTVCSCNRMVNLAILMASGELTLGCAIIAGFLHYLFLACFFWMLVEAVMLFLMVRNLKVVNYFSSHNIKIWYLCAFGYGLPVLVVAVSASVQPQGYGMHNRLLTFKAFAQLFILGCSWVLGIFQIGPMASIMAYLFTIINSLQGTFIFVIHCLLNRQVREEYRGWITRKIKPSSESQTSGMLLSSVPSTYKTG
ncbi:hypothetical protein GH733_003789, partial [Mirounga leonina]